MAALARFLTPISRPKSQGDRPLVVDSRPNGAAPGRMIGARADEISGADGRHGQDRELNVDESPEEAASKYGVMSIPMMMILKGARDGRRGQVARAKAKFRSG